MDKGGGMALIHKMWIKRLFFLNPPLYVLSDQKSHKIANKKKVLKKTN